MDFPYILIREQGGDKIMEGTAHCTLGHRIAMGHGQKDEGVFAEWRWDGASLKIENDRLGFQPLFYYQRGGEIAVSPSIWALMKAGAPLDYDHEALAVFFHFGNFVGNDTPFKAIRAVPPNSSITWRGGELAFGGGYALPVAQDISRKDAIEAYIAALRNALQRRPPDGVTALPLSGGRDSRLILLELHRAGRLPDFCITHDRGVDTDLVVARELSERIKVPLITSEDNSVDLSGLMSKLQTVNFGSLEHAILWRIKDCLIGRVESVYDGIGGDTPTTTGVHQTPERLALFRAGKLDELCLKLLRFPPAGNPLLSDEAHRRMGFDVAAARLRAELAQHQDEPNPVASFYFWNRNRRNLALAPFAILSGIPRVQSPFLDREVLDLLFSIPAENQMDFSFRDDVLKTAHPEFADIPFAQKKTGAAQANHPSSAIGRALACRLLRTGMPEFLDGGLIWPRLLLLASGLPVGRDKHWYLNYLILGHCLSLKKRL